MAMISRIRVVSTIALSTCFLALVATVPRASAASSSKTGTSRSAKVRADLHRNLDGKGDGFVVRWSYTKTQFTLTIDSGKYSANKLLAATMAARAIFDSNGVALPRVLVVRDVRGSELARGPFSNVPALMQ